MARLPATVAAFNLVAPMDDLTERLDAIDKQLAQIKEYL